MGKEIVVGAGMGRLGVGSRSGKEMLDATSHFREKSALMHSDLSKNTDRDKKQGRRPWLVMGGITLLVVGILLALFVWYDGPAPDDSMMALSPTGKRSATNPLTVFCGELEKFTPGRLPGFSGETRYPGMVARSNLERLAKPGLDSKSATRLKDAEAYIQNQAAVIDAFDKLMQTDIDTWKWQEQTSIRGRNPPKHVQQIRNFRHVLHLKVDVLTQQGRTDDAATLALKICRLGKGMCNAGGGSEQLVLGLFVIHTGQLALEHALTFSEPSAELLRRCFTELAEVEVPRRESVSLTIRTDYHEFKAHALRKDLKAAAGDLGDANLGEKLMGMLFFKPNQTLEELLTCEAPVMQALDKGWHGAYLAANEQRTAGRAEAESQGVLAYVHPNFAGKGLARMAAHGSVYKLEKALDSMIRNRQIRIVLAMRLHVLETGAVPSQLQELVPAYLPEIPKDEYSDKPMLWNAAQSKVYSVGKDLKDNGGHGEPEHRRTNDVVTIYWWMDSNKPPSSR